MTYRQPFKGDYPITQAYGALIPGVTFNNKPHTGIDYGCPSGTEILASADGVVMKAGPDLTGYGNVVIILHDAKHATLYAHLSKISIFLNQVVKQGDLIGLSGSTGNVTGPHLHFEARRIWNNFTTHFDPMLLPLTSVDDAASLQQKEAECCLKAADSFETNDVLKIVAPLGAKGWFQGFRTFTTYPQGTMFHYTGETVQHNGYTFMKVMPLTMPIWIAVNDGDTQILDNA